MDPNNFFDMLIFLGDLTVVVVVVVPSIAVGPTDAAEPSLPCRGGAAAAAEAARDSASPLYQHALGRISIATLFIIGCIVITVT